MDSINQDVKRLLKFGVALVVLLMVFLVALSLNAFKQTSYIGKDIPPMTTVSFNGEGEVVAIPDIAELTFTVSEDATTVADAQTAATKKLNDSLAALKDLGIEDKDIKTTSYTINPKYEYNQIYCITVPCPSGKSVLTGYTVSQSILLKIRDTSNAGKVVTALGNLKVSQVSGLTFSIEDDKAVIAEARGKAIADAKTQAEATAKALGVKLGDITSFYESSGPRPVYYSKDAVMGMGVATNSATSAPAVPTGENTITSNVTITYELR